VSVIELTSKVSAGGGGGGGGGVTGAVSFLPQELIMNRIKNARLMPVILQRLFFRSPKLFYLTVNTTTEAAGIVTARDFLSITAPLKIAGFIFSGSSNEL